MSTNVKLTRRPRPLPPPIKTRAKSEKPAEATPPPAPAAQDRGGNGSGDLQFLGELQERVGSITKRIASKAAIEGELLDLFCLATDWLRERRATG